MENLCNTFTNNLTISDNDILAGHLITKEKRHQLFGKVSGGSGSHSPEIYQRKTIEDYTGTQCGKTNMRINLDTYTLKEVANPNKNEDGFDYSENFDGCQLIHGKKIYINMKCVVGKGGSQMRTLRDQVYPFIKAQLKILKNSQNEQNIYFANVLDGDEASCAMSKYNYLLKKYTGDKILHRIYVGDLKNYIIWFKRLDEQ
jgi:hypothetical protein